MDIKSFSYLQKVCHVSNYQQQSESTRNFRLLVLERTSLSGVLHAMEYSVFRKPNKRTTSNR